MKYKLKNTYAIGSPQCYRIIKHWEQCGGTYKIISNNIYGTIQFIANDKNTLPEFYITFNDKTIKNIQFIEI